MSPLDPALLGARLRDARQLRGFSQQALADQAGLSRNFVAQIERGESVPTVAVLARLAEALGESVAALLGEETAAGPEGETVAVPAVSDTIAAGPARLVADNVDRIEHLPAALIANLRANARSLVLVRLGADQDSMADTIPPGAEVLVDRTPVREVTPRGIYAVREDMAGETGCSIKRLVLDRDARVLILLSDNPAHLPRAIRLRAGQAIPDVVIGRVLWWMPPPAGRN